MYQETRTLKLFHTDEAGVLFYARLYEITQETTENFLNDNGIGIGKTIRESDFITPVVHAESDYFKPLRTGHEIKVILKHIEMGESSFTTQCEVFNQEGELAGRTSVTNVCVEKKTGKKAPIPNAFKDVIKKHLH